MVRSSKRSSNDRLTCSPVRPPPLDWAAACKEAANLRLTSHFGAVKRQVAPGVMMIGVLCVRHLALRV